MSEGVGRREGGSQLCWSAWSQMWFSLMLPDWRKRPTSLRQELVVLWRAQVLLGPTNFLSPEPQGPIPSWLWGSVKSHCGGPVLVVENKGSEGGLFPVLA